LTKLAFEKLEILTMGFWIIEFLAKSDLIKKTLQTFKFAPDEDDSD